MWTLSSCAARTLFSNLSLRNYSNIVLKGSVSSFISLMGGKLKSPLGELFQKTKIAEESNGVKCSHTRVEKQKEKDADKSAVHLVKKILKGIKASHGSSSTIDNSSADKKGHKILQLFHRKVHPKTTTNSQNQSKYFKNGTHEGYKRRNRSFEDDITIILEREIAKKSTSSTRTQSS